jgi:Cft2 family RNA processing exonuclease
MILKIMRSLNNGNKIKNNKKLKMKFSRKKLKFLRNNKIIRIIFNNRLKKKRRKLFLFKNLLNSNNRILKIKTRILRNKKNQILPLQTQKTFLPNLNNKKQKK